MNTELLEILQKAWLGASTKLQNLEVLDEARGLVFQYGANITLLAEIKTS